MQRAGKTDTAKEWFIYWKIKLKMIYRIQFKEVKKLKKYKRKVKDMMARVGIADIHNDNFRGQ